MLSTHIRATVIKVKNINDIGLVFLDSHESDFISADQRLLTSFISAVSWSISLNAVSLSSTDIESSLDIKFFTIPSAPLVGSISPTIFKIPGALFFKNAAIFVSLNFFLDIVFVIFIFGF